ncbi:Mu-like prophage major head subunit gpT family protein [Azorhizobium caulinodans]|uniref:Mu-like prophage major head subunit gpT family protein n=1 Tax=Azorhizobium caulinodans TaxID=7 RepID=UPI002FBDEDB8
MDVTPQNLRLIYTGLSTAFNQRLAATTTMYRQIAMEVTSTTSQNEYPRLDEIPGLREWVGDRVIHDLSAGTYAIKNREFEGTIGVDRDKIEDDQVGLYTPIAQQLGQNTAEFPDLLTFPLLKKGHQTLCSDGQNFFDTDHPGYNETGAEISVSNYQDGTGPAWFLIDTSQVLKPLVFQNRRAFRLTAKDKLDDDNVFHKKKFIWGVDGRCNVGFGMWQLAFMSKAALTPENYAAARAAMGTLRRRDGAPLNIAPRILLHPPSLEADALKVLKATLINGGDTNVWAGTAEPVKCPWLA